MRIAYLADSRIPSDQANSLHVMRMCSAFAELGHEVTLHALRGDPLEVDIFEHYGCRSLFEVRLLDPSLLPVAGPWLRATRVRSLLRRDRPDVVYGRSLRCLLMARGDARHTAYEVHSVPSSVRRRRLEQRLLGDRRLDKLVAISSALLQDYELAYRIHAGIQRQVAADGADPQPDPLPEIVLGGRPEAVTVGYSGSLYHGRGTEMLTRFAEELPELDFHVVGGPGSEANRLRQLPIGNLIVHGRRPPSEMAAWCAAFDIALAPYSRSVTTAGGGDDTSRWMSPLKLFEYMAAGTAVVVSDLPVIREIVDESVAVLVEPENVGAWLTAIRTLASDDTMRSTLGARASEHFHSRFTWCERAAALLPVGAG